MTKGIEQIVADEFKKQGVGAEEAKHILKQLRNPERVRKVYDHFKGSKRVKIGILGDLHCGSKYFQRRVFDEAIKTFNLESVDAVYQLGDLIEGMSHREGHIYELDRIGVSSQIDLACEVLSEVKQPLFFITGNHDEWAKKKSDQGLLVGPEVERRLENAEFLGEYTADVKLGGSCLLRLTHEGQSAYALSYPGQKRINALSGGTKPEIIINGHLHKALYMFYRNIHFFEGAAFQAQTPFMAMKGSPSHVGYWVLDVGFNKKGVNELGIKFFPHY